MVVVAVKNFQQSLTLKMDGYKRRPAVKYLYPAVFFYSTILFATFPARGTLALDLIRYRLCGQEQEFDDDDGINCDEDEVCVLIDFVYYVSLYYVSNSFSPYVF